MRPLLSLIRREFTAYFVSPVAYIVLAVFLMITGARFVLSLELLSTTAALGPKGLAYPMEKIINDNYFWLVFLFIPPLLTMRLFAEERASGTLEMLMTSPLRDWQIVIGKFVACYLFYLVMWLPTLLYLPVLTDWDWWTPYCRIDPNPVLTTYLGVALVGAMLLAVGMLASSLARSQMIAALLALAIGGVFIILWQWMPANLAEGPRRVVNYLAVPHHFERNFTRGLIDTRNLVLYLSVACLCLFLTVRSVESRRWQ